MDSLTVTENVQETMVFDESVPVQVTGVVPRLNKSPDCGVQTTETQFPVVVGAG